MAQVLKIGQENVSRIEKRSDLLISTLRGFAEAMGGRLNLVAEFPDRPPVRLRTLADVGEGLGVKRRGTAKHLNRRIVRLALIGECGIATSPRGRGGDCIQSGGKAINRH